MFQNEEPSNQSQILIVMRDISVLKQLQREKALQQYSELMFASINHELRTPINIIVGIL